MKSTVITLAQGRQKVARKKANDNRQKLLSVLQEIWQDTLECLEAEFPDVGVVGVQYDILQTPNQWWTSCWSARLKKLYYKDHGKKRFMNDADMYKDMAKFRSATSRTYRALAAKKLTKRRIKGRIKGCDV